MPTISCILPLECPIAPRKDFLLSKLVWDLSVESGPMENEKTHTIITSRLKQKAQVEIESSYTHGIDTCIVDENFKMSFQINYVVGITGKICCLVSILNPGQGLKSFLISVLKYAPPLCRHARTTHQPQ